MPASIPLGIVAALGSAFAFGSFAVPIKDKRVLEAKVNALIFQAWKSLACFLTAWLVLLWADFRFTWWAGIGAIIWVTDGTMAVLSVRAAGLGVAQSIWSGVSVFVSFAWGKSYFREPIANLPLSLLGLLLMVSGMVGLGYVASQAAPETQLITSPDKQPLPDEEAPQQLHSPGTQERQLVNGLSTGGPSTEDQELVISPKSRALEEGSEEQRLVTGPTSTDPESQPHVETAEAKDGRHVGAMTGAGGHQVGEGEGDAFTRDHDPDRQSGTDGEVGSSSKEDFTIHSPWERHHFGPGVIGATLVGFLAGTMLVPLKLAPPDRKGDQYLVSFGIGVAIVTLIALGIYFAVCSLLGRQGPNFHVRVTSGPAMLAGILWSIGNYLSIIATDSLGIAVGWPLANCAIIVSNSWAIFWYKEVTGRRAIVGFFGSTALILAGMVFLGVYGL